MASFLKTFQKLQVMDEMMGEQRWELGVGERRERRGTDQISTRVARSSESSVEKKSLPAIAPCAPVNLGEFGVIRGFGIPLFQGPHFPSQMGNGMAPME
jgi:hypothetical protein